MSSARRRSPAKTNLFLEVRAKRPDGYHEVDTVLVELELADEVTLTPNRAGRIELSALGPTAAGVPTDASNLVWRALELLRQASGDEALGATVRLDKRIPAGGGLGGGSSNAAQTLVLLNDQLTPPLAPGALAELAGELGADVPFFLEGGLQRGLNRGERLTPYPAPARPLDLVLVFPDFGCPTPQVYRAMTGRIPAAPLDPTPLLAALEAGAEPTELASLLHNRLAEAAYAEFPALAELAERLEQETGALKALLSGSGSTLVALCSSSMEAVKVSDQVATWEGVTALASRTCGQGRFQPEA